MFLDRLSKSGKVDDVFLDKMSETYALLLNSNLFRRIS